MERFQNSLDLPQMDNLALVDDVFPLPFEKDYEINRKKNYLIIFGFFSLPDHRMTNR